MSSLSSLCKTGFKERIFEKNVKIVKMYFVRPYLTHISEICCIKIRKIPEIIQRMLPSGQKYRFITINGILDSKETLICTLVLQIQLCEFSKQIDFSNLPFFYNFTLTLPHMAPII